MIYDFKVISAKWELKIRHWQTKEPIDMVVEIKRESTGASPYGDKSDHSIFINGKVYKYLDTRYSGISHKKEDWLKFWQEWVNRVWDVIEMKLVDYQEEVIKQEFDW